MRVIPLANGKHVSVGKTRENHKSYRPPFGIGVFKIFTQKPTCSSYGKERIVFGPQHLSQAEEAKETAACHNFAAQL
jgi:hypothetical protein